MEPVLVGVDENNEEVLLWEEDFLTHIHGIGATRTGKTRWLVHFCLQLIFQGVGFTLLDGKGEAAEELIAALSFYLPPGKIKYFDPSRTDWLIPYNPFQHGSVETAVELTEIAWDEKGSNFTLSKWLPPVYALFKTGEFSFNEVLYLFEPDFTELRIKALACLKNPSHQLTWGELVEMKDPKKLRRVLEPVRNRLRRFVENEQFRRIFFPEGQSLDFTQAFADNDIIVANLQEKGEISAGNIRLLGMMILHEIAKASERSGNRKRKDYFLILDEAADFIVPSLRKILDKGAGKGIHLGVFHQTLSQLSRQDAWVYESVLAGARMKVVFGGISKQNANVLAGNMFTNKWERDTELATYLTRQPQRNFTLARPNKEVEHLLAPTIEYADVPEDYRDELIVKYFIKPYGASVQKMDERLAQRRAQARGGQSDPLADVEAPEEEDLLAKVTVGYTR